MAEPLSQAEIDTLFGTMSAEDEATAATTTGPADRTPRSPAAAGAVAHDFSHPAVLSRDQARALRLLHDEYAHGVAKRLSTELLTRVSARVVSIDSLTYAEFLMLLPQPAVLSVIEVPQLDGRLAVELSPDLSFAFVDRLLGGEGIPIEGLRALTAIERELMERVLEQCFRELTDVWAPIHPLEFRLRTIEANPELARVVDPQELVLVVSLELRIQDVAGTMNLCLPHRTMEPALRRLVPERTDASAAPGVPVLTEDALRESMATSELDVEVDLGHATISLRELLELEPGDVVPFTPASPSGVVARVEGVPRFEGSAGSSRGHYAVRVERSTAAPEPPGDAGGAP